MSVPCAISFAPYWLPDAGAVGSVSVKALPGVDVSHADSSPTDTVAEPVRIAGTSSPALLVAPVFDAAIVEEPSVRITGVDAEVTALPTITL